MRDLLLRHRSPGIIIDTNLLLLMLVGEHSPDRIERFKPTRSHFVALDYGRLRNILAPVEQNLAVTPHILTEVSNFLGKGSFGEEMYAIRALLARYLSHFDLQDIPVSTLINPTHVGEFCKFGMTDAVLIHLARKGYLVLTVDFPLAQYIESIGKESLNYNHVSCGSILPRKWR